jgi:hypothetical protein
MTPGAREDLAGRLHGVLIAVGDRLGSERAGEAHHYIEVGEYGLALEEIAGMLGLAQAPSPARSAMTCWRWPAG